MKTGTYLSKGLSRIKPQGVLRSAGGFTMVEVALSIGIVAFAMVAILGVLPMGMEVKKTNREETIINEEGRYWLEAIRSGSKRLHNITNQVELIIVSNHLGQVRQWGAGFLSQQDIVGLLSTPKYTLGNNGQVLTNFVGAVIRPANGPAYERDPDNELVMRYFLSASLVPYAAYPTNSVQTNFNVALPDNELMIRSNRWAFAQRLRGNLFDLELTLQWPVTVGGSANALRIGNSRKSFRTLVGGSITNLVSNRGRGAKDLYFLNPNVFQGLQQ
jgi:type II secretory pathway pseudopilin PulG